MALTILEGVQATISPARMVTGARGGRLASGSNAKPDWNDEPSESMLLKIQEENGSNFNKHCGEIMDPSWSLDGI